MSVSSSNTRSSDREAGLPSEEQEILRFGVFSTPAHKDRLLGIEAQAEARRRLSYIYGTLRRAELLLGDAVPWRDAPPDRPTIERFCQALDEDFAVPAALGRLSPLLKEANEYALIGAQLPRAALPRLASIRRTFQEVGRLLGVFLQEPGAFLAHIEQQAATRPFTPAEIEEMIEQRRQARLSRQRGRAGCHQPEASGEGTPGNGER